MHIMQKLEDGSWKLGNGSPISHLRSPTQRARAAFTLEQRGRRGGFTLAEMLVAIGVLTLIVLLVTQILNGAARIVTLGHKRMDSDSQARQVFDRLAVDFDQWVKR